MLNYINLYDLVELNNNEEVCRSYVRYICGFAKEKQYRHLEINNIASLLSFLKISKEQANGFLFGYEVPQLNKEFDLIKITEELCLNIEIKGNNVPLEKVKKQLKQNRHYLKLLHKDLVLITYFANSNTLYLLRDEDLVEVDKSYLINCLNSNECLEINLDKTFSPQNILVSPLNNPRKFLEGDYLLTENQEIIKNKILDSIAANSSKFFGLTGNAGTGKTLLLYDLAYTLSKRMNILLIHGGILCEGHNILNSNIPNLKIISAKEINSKEIKDVDVVFLDESHRMYKSVIEKTEKWVNESKAVAVFSYDTKQKLSAAEVKRDTVSSIKLLCNDNIFELTNKIRTNREIALFITCLRDLSKMKPEYKFSNVRLEFIGNKQEAHNKACAYCSQGYTYITFTASFYNNEIDYQDSRTNTHTVIGQEFDKVCMIMDEHFFYDKNILKARMHPNPDYIFEQLLYQGLTRVRSDLLLIITDEKLLKNILKLFNT